MKQILMQALRPRGSQAQLARDLDLPTTTVNNWANGRNVPEPERWAAVEHHLGLETGVLERAAGTTPLDADEVSELRKELRRLDAYVLRLQSELDELRAAAGSPSAASGSPRSGVRSTSAKKAPRS